MRARGVAATVLAFLDPQRVVVYGSGIDPSSSSHYSITRRDWHAVRRDIGRPDAERRIYRLRTPTRRYKCDQPA